jgi:microcystin-dependent protein
MSQPYIGEIRLFAGNFAPSGWAFCDGRLVAIVENETLFNLIGTTYGGDGQNTFALPDLQGRIPVHQGTGAGMSTVVMGQVGGSETVTLTAPNLPAHTHVLRASALDARLGNADGAVLAAPVVNNYSGSPSLVAMSTAAVGAAGGAAQPHDNMAPFGTISYIISLFGIFPSPA